jgi:hypothetical protein
MKKAKDIGRVFALLSFAIIFIAAISGQATAQVTYYFTYDSMFNAPMAGGVAPTGTWATAKFVDVGGGTVQMTLSANSITSAEDIRALYFNYSGDLSGLTWTPVDTSAATPTIETGGATYTDNSYKADGDGWYDILFSFSGGMNKLTAGESVIYNISGGVSPSDFYEKAAPGTGGNGPFYAAVKLTGIPCGDIYDPNCQQGTTSAWAAGVVPEPVSSTLFLVGAATLGFRRFRKKFKA